LQRTEKQHKSKVPVSKPAPEDRIRATNIIKAAKVLFNNGESLLPRDSNQAKRGSVFTDDDEQPFRVENCEKIKQLILELQQ
jgi:hypothetical protein